MVEDLTKKHTYPLNTVEGITQPQLYSTIAHEIATPLSTVQGYLEMMEQGLAGEMTPHQQKLLRAALRSMVRMNQIVDDLSTFGKLKSKKLELNLQPIEITEVLYETVGILFEQIQVGEVGLQMSLNEEMPLVLADRVRVAQIVTNLLSNAVKYTRPKGTVTVSTTQVGDFVQVNVRDTGVGISREDQQKLFSPYYRAEDVYVQSKSGTGLGLMVVKELVDLQGGQVWLESEMNVGTTVSFTLPMLDSTPPST
jgi:signal transduction histidine kinase